MKVPSMERKGLFWLVGLVMVWIMAGCGADSVFDDNINWRSALTVVVDPSDGTDDVPTNRPIYATFNKALVEATVNENNFYLKDAAGTIVPGSLTYFNKVVTFTPDAELAEYSDYVFTITTSVTSTEGVHLDPESVTHFTTGGPSEYLTVSISPPNNASNVEVDPTISATFDMPIDMTTVTDDSFYIVKAGTTAHLATNGFLYDAATHMAYFTLAGNLEDFTEYTVHVTTDVLSTTGRHLEVEKTSTFETGDWEHFKVNVIEPLDGAVNVSRTTPIIAEFNREVNEATLSSGTAYLMEVGGPTVAGTWIKPLPNGTDFIFTLAEPLKANTTYQFVFKSSIASTDGATLGEDSVTTFTTGNWTDFRVVYVKPENGEDNVSISTDVQAWFNYTADETSLTDTNVYMTDSSLNPVVGVIDYLESGGSHILVFNPNASLDANTTYIFTIKSDVNSTLGDHLSDDNVTQFTTGDFVTPEPVAAVFSLAPTSVTVDTNQSDVLGGLLGGLLGVQAQVDAAGVQGLAEIDLTMSDFLPAIAAATGAETVDDLLNSSISLADLLEIISTEIGTLGAADSQAVIDSLLAQVNADSLGGTSVPVSSLLQFPLDTLPLSINDLMALGSYPASQVNTLSLLSGLNQALQPLIGEPIALPLAIEGLTSADSGLWLQVTTPPTVALLEEGDTMHSSETRLMLKLSLLGELFSDLDLGDGGLLNLPLYLELGSAEVNLTKLSDDNITVSVRNGLARLYIGDINSSIFFTQERLSPEDFGTVDAVNVLGLVKITLKGYAVGEAETTQLSYLPINVAQMASSYAPAGSDVDTLLYSLVDNLQVDVELLGIPLSLTDVLHGLLSPLLDILVPILGPLLNSVSDLLGTYAGRADVTMQSLIYGQTAQ